MIRHIRLTDQVNDGANDFAFFDTVVGRFIEIGGRHLFADLADLQEAMDEDGWPERLRARLIELHTGEP